MKIKPVTATISPGIKVQVFGNDYEVDNPLAFFYASLVGCVGVHVGKMAKRLGLHADRIEVSMTGEAQDMVLSCISINIETFQEHPYGKTLEQAVLNCQVLQHLDPDIDIEVRAF